MALDFDDLEVAECALRYDSAVAAELEFSGPDQVGAHEIKLRIREGLSGDEVCSLFVNCDMLVSALKASVAHRACIPASEQRLFAGDVQLCDHQVLGEVVPMEDEANAAEVSLIRASAARSKVLEDVKSGKVGLQRVPEEFQCDTEIVVAALSQDVHVLQHAVPAALQNRGLILQAVQHDGANLQYAAEDLREQFDIVMAAVQQKGDSLVYVPSTLQKKQEVVIAAVRQNGLALRHVPLEMRSDFEVVLAAVGQNGRALVYADSMAKQNRKLLLAAVGSSGGAALGHADKNIRASRDLVKEAVQLQGLALEFASEELKQDRSVVLAAVRSNGLALAYAAPQLQNDAGVVLEAVQKHGMALKWASDGLRKDKTIVLAALHQSKQAIRFAVDSVISPVVMAAAEQLGIFQDDTLDVFLTVTPEAAQELCNRGEALLFDARFLDTLHTSLVPNAHSLLQDPRLVAQNLVEVVNTRPENFVIIYSDNGWDERGQDVLLARMLRRDARLQNIQKRHVLRLAGGLNWWKDKGLSLQGDPRMKVWKCGVRGKNLQSTQFD